MNVQHTRTSDSMLETLRSGAECRYLLNLIVIAEVRVLIVFISLNDSVQDFELYV